MKVVGIRKRVTEIPREGAIHEVIVGTLAVGLEISSRSRIIELPEDAAEVASTTCGRKIAAFGVNAECWNTGITAVREELDDAGDGIAAVNSAFRATHNFDLVDVFGGEAGEIHAAAGRIDGRAVHQDFGEVGIASVKENGGAATEWPGAIRGDAGGKLQQFGQRSGLAIGDGFAGDDVGGRGGLLRG